MCPNVFLISEANYTGLETNVLIWSLSREYDENNMQLRVTKSSRKSGRRVHPASPHRHRKHRQIEGQCLQSITRNLLSESAITVSGQNKIGRELTLLAFIERTGNKQNAVHNN